MKPILVFQNASPETPGCLEDYFRQAGLDWQMIELFRQPPDRLDFDQVAGLVALGGPMNVDEVDKYPFLATEVDWIREAVDLRVPFLGVCLGAQLLAKALGSPVYPNRVKEIGWYEIELTPHAADDPLFRGCAPGALVFQWHGDTFDLPPGAVHLARSEGCPHQAFRFGSSAWGLQFHIEMTPELIASWVDDAERHGEFASLKDVDPAVIRRRVPEGLAAMGSLREDVLGRFVETCRRQQ